MANTALAMTKADLCLPCLLPFTCLPKGRRGTARPEVRTTMTCQVLDVYITYVYIINTYIRGVLGLVSFLSSWSMRDIACCTSR